MKFGMEMFRKKNVVAEAEAEDQKEPEETLEKEEVDNGRRNFLRSGVAAAAVAASYVVGGEVEAKGETFAVEVEYLGFRPSKHEETLVKINLQALVPDAISVQIAINAPDSTFGKDVETQNMRMSVIFKDGRSIDVIGTPVFHTPGANQNARLINGLFGRLREKLATSR